MEPAPDPLHGQALYAPCIPCHGSQGEGGEGGPRLARQLRFYLESRMTEFQEVHGKETLPWSGGNGQGLADLSHYLFHLNPPAPLQPIPLDADLEKGRSHYQEECAYCHGDEGHGKPKSTLRRNRHGPALTGLSSDYLRQQIQRYQAGQRGAPRMRREVANLGETETRDLLGYIATLAGGCEKNF